MFVVTFDCLEEFNDWWMINTMMKMVMVSLMATIMTVILSNQFNNMSEVGVSVPLQYCTQTKTHNNNNTHSSPIPTLADLCVPHGILYRVYCAFLLWIPFYPKYHIAILMFLFWGWHKTLDTHFYIKFIFVYNAYAVRI